MVISSVYYCEQDSVYDLKKLHSHPDFWQDKSITKVCSEVLM